MNRYEHIGDKVKSHHYIWTDLRKGDEVQEVKVAFAEHLSVQVIAGKHARSSPGRMVVEGSLEFEPKHFYFLRDMEGDLLSYSGDGGGPISGRVAHVRPRVTDGDENATFTVVLFARS